MHLKNKPLVIDAEGYVADVDDKGDIADVDIIFHNGTFFLQRKHLRTEGPSGSRIAENQGCIMN